MDNILEEFIICKCDLIKIILNMKHLDKNTLNEVKTNLLLVDNLRKQLSETENLDCSKELIQVQKCIANIK